MEKSIYTGAFVDEKAQRFVRFLVDLGDKGFSELYQKFGDNPPNFKKGLERSATWSNETIRDDYDYVKETWSDCESLYDSVFLSYIKSVRGINPKTHKLMVRIPNILEFVRIYLISLARHREMQTCKFFKEGIILQRVICMDAARDAFFALDVNDNVQEELRSQVSAVEPSLHLKGGRSEIHLSGATEVDLDTLSKNVKPDDSVSNVGKERTPSIVSKHKANDDIQSVTLSSTSKVPRRPKSVVSAVSGVKE
jgi:hypothetical protein